MITTKNWELSEMTAADLDWIHANCVAVSVSEPVWHTPRRWGRFVEGSVAHGPSASTPWWPAPDVSVQEASQAPTLGGEVAPGATLPVRGGAAEDPTLLSQDDLALSLGSDSGAPEHTFQTVACSACGQRLPFHRGEKGQGK